jgi:FtsP/CotA-like multicopper oxidase with cupredoxin domain
MRSSRIEALLSESRRRFLLAGAAAALPFVLYRRASSAAAPEYRLVARKDRVRIVPVPHPETDVWCYNGSVPGPEIRIRQGERLRVTVENLLDEETTVHWHGVRVPNAMDGVPFLTQQPIAARGGTFVYEFDVPDAGTYWYHPHQRGFEQVGRGLSGPLIVEERNPPQVDRDVTWVLDDWRLDRDASISGGFGNFMDASHAGRIGNTVTVNGQVRESFEVRAGERIRLRLVNTANARIFGLQFADHRPIIIALDGQPVEPHEPASGRVVLGPAMRADLILDMTGKTGLRYRIMDTFYRRLEYRVLDLVYAGPGLRSRSLQNEIRLSANPLAEPDLAVAERHEVVFSGGMMGGTVGMGDMSGMMGDMSGMMGNMGSMPRGMAWAINGVSATEHVHEPMLVLRRGASYVLRLVNDTAWHHPIHLHGHAFRVISRNGRPAQYREWLDTVLVAPRETTEIAFVADNPGDWMFHCHILEHQAAGMMANIRVA